jgi:ferrochelatase
VSDAAPIGVFVMAYGTASGPDDIERYYTDIRGGRAPSPAFLEELVGRYEAIGNRFPLLDITRAQAAGLEAELNRRGRGTFRSYLGMKHSPPSIADGVGQMRDEGIERAVGIVMAPHWSGMSIPTYADRARAALGDASPAFTCVRSFHDHPGYVALLADRVREAMAELPEGVRDDAIVIVSAHSLPVRTLEDGSGRCLRCEDEVCTASCRYHDGLTETASLVAATLGLPGDGWTTAWQSAGRTADPWWGPPIEDVIRDLAAEGVPAVVVCSAGFVSDHLEILYDLDIEARRIAETGGMAFARTRMPNDDPAFVSMLADVVLAHLDGGPEA